MKFGISKISRTELKLEANIFRLALSKTWTQYSRITSIHGLRYINEPGSTIVAKITWLLIFVTFLCCAIVTVMTFYFDFILNPTRINVESNHVPISELYYPAVTICPANHISYSKSFDVLSSLILPVNVTVDDVMGQLTLLNGLSQPVAFTEKDLQIFQEILTTNQYSMDQLVTMMSFDCTDILRTCRFEMKNIDCQKLFQISRSFSGNCCSFNINQKGIPFQKFQALMHGIRGGLSVVLRYPLGELAVIMKYNKKMYEMGFKVLVHDNAAFPDNENMGFLIPANREYFMGARPIQIVSSQQVRALTIDDRQCAFIEELPSKYFDEYVQSNCRYECQIHKFVKYCDCVPHTFFPQEDNKVCDFMKIPCVANNWDEIMLVRGNVASSCNCLPNCQDVTYEAQPNHIIIGPGRIRHSLDTIYEEINVNGTTSYNVIHVYMKSQVFKRLRRDLLSNLITLISNLGSAFSLFVGLSIISVIEVMYYFTFILRKNYRQLQHDTNHKTATTYMGRLEKSKTFRKPSAWNINLDKVVM